MNSIIAESESASMNTSINAKNVSFQLSKTKARVQHNDQIKIGNEKLKKIYKEYEVVKEDTDKFLNAITRAQEKLNNHEESELNNTCTNDKDEVLYEAKMKF